MRVRRETKEGIHLISSLGSEKKSRFLALLTYDERKLRLFWFLFFPPQVTSVSSGFIQKYLLLDQTLP